MRCGTHNNSLRREPRDAHAVGYISRQTQKRYVSPFVRSTSRRSDRFTDSIRYFAQRSTAVHLCTHGQHARHRDDRTRCALRSRAASVFVSATGHSAGYSYGCVALARIDDEHLYTHMKDIWDAPSTVNGTACARTCECCEDALSSLHQRRPPRYEIDWGALFLAHTSMGRATRRNPRRRHDVHVVTNASSCR